ncbi:MAG: hypothetical protein WEA09_14730 [Gemmatimonadota bacterium]
MNPRNLNSVTLRTLVVPVVAVALLVLPATGEAQVRFTPQVGAYLPVTDMGEFRASTSEERREFGRRNSSLAYGASLEFSPPLSPFGIRTTWLYGSDGSVPLKDVGCDGPCPRSTLLTGSLEAVVRAGLPLVQPHLSLGVALKRYGFEFEQGFPRVIEDQDQWGMQVGVGATVSVLGMGVALELSDFIGGLEGADGSSGGRQHDMFLTLGLALGR